MDVTDLHGPARATKGDPCAVTGCPDTFHARGWCKTHGRQYRHRGHAGVDRLWQPPDWMLDPKPLDDALARAAARRDGVVLPAGRVDVALAGRWWRARRAGRIAEDDADRIARAALDRTVEDVYGWSYHHDAEQAGLT